MKKLYRDVIAKVQQTIMKRYGHFTETGFVFEKEVPTPVSNLLRNLGKWLVALDS